MQLKSNKSAILIVMLDRTNCIFSVFEVTDIVNEDIFDPVDIVGTIPNEHGLQI